MTPPSLDAAIVGAGPAGSALAASLAHAGARVLLLDAARHPRPKACAEYASPRIAEELLAIGLPPAAWTDTVAPLEGMDLVAGRHRVRLAYRDRAGRRRHAWGVERRAFDARLAVHAASAGADLRERARVVGLVAEGERVVGIRVRDTATARESVVRADWVVGADGARSTVARLLGVERAVLAPRRLGLVAHHEPVDGLADHGEMHVGRGWYVGLAPTGAGMLNVGMALPMDGSARAAEARFRAAIEALPAVRARLGGAVRLGPIRGATPIGHRVSDVAGPGWLLVGDAAGFVDPFTGEGIHRALRSSRAAATALGGDPGRVAATYRAERRRAFAAKSALGWLIQGTLAVPGLLEHAVSRLESRPELLTRLGSALGDLRPATDALAPRAVIEVLRP